jgi:hypothetical protein
MEVRNFKIFNMTTAFYFDVSKKGNYTVTLHDKIQGYEQQGKEIEFNFSVNQVQVTI